MPKTIIIVLMYDFFVFACLEHRKNVYASANTSATCTSTVRV